MIETVGHMIGVLVLTVCIVGSVTSVGMLICSIACGELKAAQYCLKVIMMMALLALVGGAYLV